MKNGWTRLYRGVLNTKLWKCSTPEQKVVFITLLLMEINSGDHSSPGEFLTFKDTLVNLCGKGITLDILEEALEFLKNEGCISYRDFGSKFSIKFKYFFNDNRKEGWIKLHKTLLESSIWSTTVPRQRVVFIVLLLKGNFKRNTWSFNGRSYDILPGDMITSVKSIVLSSGEGVKTQSVRLALKRFEKSGFISYGTDFTSHLIRITNWDRYQNCYVSPSTGMNKGGTKPKQRVNKGGTTNNTYKTYKNINTYKNISMVVQNDNGGVEKDGKYKRDYDEFLGEGWSAI